jgi:hypothetical protein
MRLSLHYAHCRYAECHYAECSGTKYKTRVEVTDSDKHSSLLWYGINYGRKNLTSYSKPKDRTGMEDEMTVNEMPVDKMACRYKA